MGCVAHIVCAYLNIAGVGAYCMYIYTHSVHESESGVCAYLCIAGVGVYCMYM